MSTLGLDIFFQLDELWLEVIWGLFLSVVSPRIWCCFEESIAVEERHWVLPNPENSACFVWWKQGGGDFWVSTNRQSKHNDHLTCRKKLSDSWNFRVLCWYETHDSAAASRFRPVGWSRLVATSMVEKPDLKLNPSGNTGFALLLDVAATDDDGKRAHVITDGLAEVEQQLRKFRPCWPPPLTRAITEWAG